MEVSKSPHYVLFLLLFFLAASLSMWGQYVTLPYKSLSMFEAYKMAMPYVWLDWFVMTYGIYIADIYSLFTPTQITFLIIITQFVLLLIINLYYLKKNIYRSDYLAFFIILIGFYISFSNYISYIFHIPLPKSKRNKVTNTVDDTGDTKNDKTKDTKKKNTEDTKKANTEDTKTDKTKDTKEDK